MPAKVYKCGDCGFEKEYLQQPKAEGGYTNSAPDNCPECGSDKYEKNFLLNVQGISFDVPGGYDYEYGKKAAVSGRSGASAQADAMYKASIGQNPY
jgi:predicted nucleic acid-binding Zn ribbon protein